MRKISLCALLFLSLLSYGQTDNIDSPIYSIVNNTVFFVPDENKLDYVIVSRHKDFVETIDFMLAFVRPKQDNLITAFSGREEEVLYDYRKKRYYFDGGQYRSFRDLLSAVKFFLLTN
jgi:hypothetical protein